MSIKSLILAVVLSVISLSSFAEVVNINKANAATFKHYLKGIGAKKAESIVKYRTEHKRFKTVAEIKEVRGIGDKIFKKIKENLSLAEGVVSVSKTKTKTVKKKVKKADEVVEDKIENRDTDRSDSVHDIF
ncbi:MAG: helix-hairpin-helix domain-containing protein [Cocleimonas sp.]|nr:helix-hairpin-helix domain-containing protein [Cocleimonas sp.]